MGDELNALLERARLVRMTDQERDQQRRSFVYGNTGFENGLITRKMVDEVAEGLKKKRA